MKVKYAINIEHKKVFLSGEQIEMLVDLLSKCEMYEEKWMGTGKGTTGSDKSYTPVIREFDVETDLSPRMMSQEKIDAIRFVQKQLESSND